MAYVLVVLVIALQLYFATSLVPCRNNYRSFSATRNVLQFDYAFQKQRFFSTYSTKATVNEYSISSHSSMRQKISKQLKDTAKRLLPLLAVASVLMVLIMFPSSSFAAVAKKKIAATAPSTITETTANSPATFAKFLAKAGKIFEKIVYGVNAKSASRMLKKAGDTRSEISGLINAVTMLFTLGAWAFVANLLAKREEAAELARMRREVQRESEYKENMYFEAVEQIVKKLADSKLKGSTRADLTKQLKELDPDGAIRAFLEGKTSRPDLSGMLSKSPPKKKAVDPNASLKRKKPEKAADPTPAAKTKKEFINVDEEDDKEEVVEKKKDVGKQVLEALDDSLTDVLSTPQRAKLIGYLQERIDSIKVEAKRTIAINKIAERLGDDEYWVDYADNI